MRGPRKVKLYGRIEHQTEAALLFYVNSAQPQDVPRAALCRSLWFPKSSIRWFVDRQGREVLSVRLSRLKQKLAEEISSRSAAQPLAASRSHVA